MAGPSWWHARCDGGRHERHLGPASGRSSTRTSRGPGPLSDAELLDVVFGSGARGACVMEVAEAVLRSCGGLAGLALAAGLDLRGHAGIGPVRAGAGGAGLEPGGP